MRNHNHLGWVDVKALALAIGLCLILAGLSWLIASLQSADLISELGDRLNRVEVIMESHMEGHPQTVRETIHSHMQDHAAHYWLRQSVSEGGD